jgi:hypothetical protein
MSQTFRTAYRAASKAYVREMNLNTRTLDIDVYRGHFPLRSQTQKNTENLGVLHATSLEQATRFFIDPDQPHLFGMKKAQSGQW